MEVYFDINDMPMVDIDTFHNVAVLKAPTDESNEESFVGLSIAYISLDLTDSELIKFQTTSDFTQS